MTTTNLAKGKQVCKKLGSPSRFSTRLCYSVSLGKSCSAAHWKSLSTIIMLWVKVVLWERSASAQSRLGSRMRTGPSWLQNTINRLQCGTHYEASSSWRQEEMTDHSLFHQVNFLYKKCHQWRTFSALWLKIILIEPRTPKMEDLALDCTTFVSKELCCSESDQSDSIHVQ